MKEKLKNGRIKPSVHAYKKTPTAFKDWCRKNGITQAQIHADTHYSYRTIHHLWNGGTKVNKSTIHHLSLTYKIDEAELTKMFLPVGKKR